MPSINYRSRKRPPKLDSLGGHLREVRLLWRFIINTPSETRILDLYTKGDDGLPRPFIWESPPPRGGDCYLVVACWSVRPCLGSPTPRVTLARGLKDSPGLQAKFSGRVILLAETTLRLFRFSYLAIKARTDNKTKAKIWQIVKELDTFGSYFADFVGIVIIFCYWGPK